MTPTEKAKDLVCMFRPYSYSSDGLNSMEREYQIEDNSKQCALIAVDEMLDVLVRIFESYEERKYWEEVKQEIEKL